MSRTTPQDEIRLDLHFAPNASLVGSVRRFVKDFFERALGDTATSESLGMVAHELLDNAVKYSVDTQAPVAIEISRDAHKGPIRIATRNKTTTAHIARLKALVEAMNGSESAMTFYQSLLRETAKRLDGSGLGLARIWAEADMRVSISVDGDDVVLSAITTPALHLSYESVQETP